MIKPGLSQAFGAFLSELGALMVPLFPHLFVYKLRTHSFRGIVKQNPWIKDI
jgi:hypothetical protein